MQEQQLTSLMEASLKDGVTGLYNRKHLMARLQALMAKSTRNREKMALILWDIDGFVSFNNEFGQAAGDMLLRKVADVITASLRAYDEAFRIGADEFCAILMPADETSGADVTSRVSQSIEQGLFAKEAEYAGRQFSMAQGKAFYPGAASNPESLLHEAKQDLFRARKRP